jgi:ABC-2 type transport system permease protein
VHYQLLLLVRTPRAAFAGLLLPLGPAAAARHGHPGAGLVAVLTVLGALSTGYLTHAAGLVTARESGVLRRWRASPLPPWAFFAGRMVATTLVAVGGAVATLAVAAVAYHVGPGPAGAVGVLVALVVGTFVRGRVGHRGDGRRPPPRESAQPVLSLTFYPLVLLYRRPRGAAGGSGRLGRVLGLLPVEPMIDAVTRALQQGTGVLPPAGDLPSSPAGRRSADRLAGQLPLAAELRPPGDAAGATAASPVVSPVRS